VYLDEKLCAMYTHQLDIKWQLYSRGGVMERPLDLNSPLDFAIGRAMGDIVSAAATFRGSNCKRLAYVYGM
jgi:hypothetical protein